MGHTAWQECYGKGSESIPACSASECRKKHAKEFHILLRKDSSRVNVLEYEDDEEEKGNMNLVMGKNDAEGERWRTPGNLAGNGGSRRREDFLCQCGDRWRGAWG
jgi:hypothetical protein